MSQIHVLLTIRLKGFPQRKMVNFSLLDFECAACKNGRCFHRHKANYANVFCHRNSCHNLSSLPSFKTRSLLTFWKGRNSVHLKYNLKFGIWVHLNLGQPSSWLRQLLWRCLCSPGVVLPALEVSSIPNVWH